MVNEETLVTKVDLQDQAPRTLVRDKLNEEELQILSPKGEKILYEKQDKLEKRNTNFQEIRDRNIKEAFKTLQKEVEQYALLDLPPTTTVEIQETANEAEVEEPTLPPTRRKNVKIEAINQKLAEIVKAPENVSSTSEKTPFVPPLQLNLPRNEVNLYLVIIR